MDLSFLSSADVVNNAAAVPIVVAITQLFKMLSPKLEKYAPFVSLALGVLIAFISTASATSNVGSTILAGILYGLSASGLYSATKSTAHAITPQSNNSDPKA
jgi:Sec-independent protein secretion pathway component TatC